MEFQSLIAEGNDGDDDDLVVMAFFLACDDFWRMFDNSFPACVFLVLLF